MRKVVILFGLALVLGVGNWAVIQKESILSDGREVLLQLAPRDPRSLMQGDYMALRYAAAIPLAKIKDIPPSGLVVMKDDDSGVARFVRLDDGAVLCPAEYLLRYRRAGNGYRLGPNAFFFQEGTAEKYDSARYGLLRVNESGDSVMVDLLDESRNSLGNPDDD